MKKHGKLKGDMVVKTARSVNRSCNKIKEMILEFYFYVELNLDEQIEIISFLAAYLSIRMITRMTTSISSEAL